MHCICFMKVCIIVYLKIYKDGGMEMNVTGIIPALITPFDGNYDVNYSSLRHLVNRLIEQGVGGFYVCGSTAECFLLSDEERMRIMEVVTEEVNGRVGVIAHVGNINQRKAIEYAKHAQSCGVTAVSSVPPFYYKFKKEEIASYYAAISDAVDIPLIVYCIPALSGVTLTVDDISNIMKVSNAQGLKYTAYDLFELEKIKRRHPDLALFYGRDEMFCSALPLGLAGAIGSTYNVMPQKFIAIQKAYEEGNMKLASQIQSEANSILEVLIQNDTKSSMKYLLTKGGIDCGGARPPVTPLDDAKKAILDEIYPLIFR